MLVSVEHNREALRIAARQNAEREFAASTVVAKLIGVLESVAGKPYGRR
jgi:hypothetical protein